MTRLRDKKSFRLSATTVYRERAPTSPEIANMGNPRMVIDFSDQKPMVPERIGQTTRYGENDGRFRPMNRGGKPFSLNTMVGGSPDVKSRHFGDTTQHLSPKRGK